MKQMFAKSKLVVLFMFFIISGCSSVFDSLYMNQSSKQSTKFLVGVLLPLSGKYEKVGKNILDAINIAYYDSKNPYISLKIYDTKGDPKVAKEAVDKAINDGVHIIVGPVLSATTTVVSKATAGYDIPVLTFSNDIDVLKNTENTYSLSYLPSVELEMMIDFAINSKNSKRFAILAPQNKYGELMVATARESLLQRGMQEPYVISYPGNEIKLEKYLRPLVESDELAYYRKIDYKIKKGEIVYDSSNIALEKAPLPKLQFDTLIIADYGDRLNILASHLPFVDVNYTEITILGNSNWNNAKTYRDDILQTAYFPIYLTDNQKKLREQYALYYGKKPNGFDYNAYDSIMLVSSLVYLDADHHIVNNFTKEAITSFSLKKDRNLGIFNVREDGISIRKLDIYNIMRKNISQVKFNIDYNNAIKIPNYQTLKVGKIVDYTPDTEKNKKEESGNSNDKVN